MTTPKAPQDRRPKAKAIAAEADQAPFTFDHDGETYELPSGADAAGNIPGRLIRDAVMGGDDLSEMRLAFATLEAAGPDEDALDALYAKPNVEMMGILSDWMQSMQGTTPGK